MDDPEGMRGMDRLADLDDAVCSHRNGHRPALLEDLTEIPTLEVLHHDEGRAGRLLDACVEHAHDVLALDADGGARLADEALALDLVLRRLGMKELDGDHLVELLVPRRDHDAHAASAEHALDDVLPHAVAGDGSPYVLMVDRSTTGGYPKIATIIRADIGRFAQKTTGDSVVFASTDIEGAVTALRELKAKLDSVGNEPRTAMINIEALSRGDGASGVCDALLFDA